MQTFRRLKKYKAREPEETVAIIRNILAECGITVSEDKRYYEEADVYSCRIWISGGDLEYGDFGTNGKGMTESYSLASAYAEFMERLQNLILFGDYPEDAFNKGLTKYAVAPDEVMMNAGECIEEAGGVLKTLFRMEDVQTSDTGRISCVPYADMINGGQIFLPHKTLRTVIGSNGMCAGNTFKEAVTQGLSEIYERAAVREAYLNEPEIRLLHIESFKDNLIFDKLKKMEASGYGVNILDLSMGRNYPVVGLLLERNGRKAFRAGADPCPVTALERCLSEIYQGERVVVDGFFQSSCCEPFPKATNEWQRYEINDQEIAYHVDGSGKAPNCIFHPSDLFNEDYKGTDAESEASDFEYMIALTKKLGHSLYVRDWSFLGFPAYQCIIPELSNYDLIYEDGAEVYGWSFEKTVFRNDRFTKGLSHILNKMFEKYEKNLPEQGNLL